MQKVAVGTILSAVGKVGVFDWGKVPIEKASTFNQRIEIMTMSKYHNLPNKLIPLLMLFTTSLMMSGEVYAVETAAVQSGANAITQTVVQQGVLNCVGRIEQVTNFLGFSPQAGVVVMIPPSQPDQRMIPLAMEVEVNSGSAYVSAAFAPNQANGCGAVYDAVIYSPQKCDALASKEFAGFKKVGKLKKDIIVLDGGVASKVFLMPAGSGCVSIKKEVVL